jgi:hypothetical protein
MATRADDPLFDHATSSLQPGSTGFIVAGGDVLYKTSWHDNDNRTFTHAKVEIFIPAGWTLVSSDPSGCTRSAQTVTCPWGTLHFDDVVAQAVRLRSNNVTGTATVDSQLTVYEGPGNPGRANHIPSDGAKTVRVDDPATHPDENGSCVGGGDHLRTVPGSGGSDTDATAPSTDELCTPITIEELVRQNPTEFCISTRECVTEIVKTDATLVPATTPIQLKIVFRGTGLNSSVLIFTSAGHDPIEVSACPGSTIASPDPCYYDRRARQQSVTWFLNWSGRDPTWTGGG